MTLNNFQDGEAIHAPGLNAIVNAHEREAILSGCTPSKGSGNWDVDVTSGRVIVNGTEASVSAGTVSLTAPGSDADLDSGEARVDLVTADNTGTLSATEGTASSGDKKPISPDIPAGEVLIAAVFVDADASSLTSSDISSYRVVRSQTIAASETDDLSDVTHFTSNDASSTNQTVVDVTGSGFLLDCVARTNADDGSSLLVTVDGGTQKAISIPGSGPNIGNLPTIKFESSLEIIIQQNGNRNIVSAWVKQ